ncbi:rust resistance kinase Lr10-like [Typha angustifolia]|uniref:rust resistance kinase Lr10-like n=1 Tax=Typha angustifolia TaxID=59011 RepID=UPI003C2D4CD3
MSNSSKTAIALVVVAGIVVLVIATMIIRCVQKIKMQKINATAKRSSNTRDTPLLLLTAGRESAVVEMEPIERFLDEIMKEKPMRFTPQQLLDFTKNYSQQLGAGGFGKVYKGEFPNGIQIAVKVLNSSIEKRPGEQFIAEVSTIGRTYHKNLVRLYGFCFDATVKALVYEYMEKGSLDQYLFSNNNNNNTIEREKLYEIAIGTAMGIRYLHEECQHKIIHYDIKPGNVLLTANFTPKVGDFGLAKLCDSSSNATVTGEVRGTPGYAAPELWKQLPGGVTNKCDVYSFGMFLLEILGRRRNLDTGQAESELEWYPRWVWNKFEQGEMERILSFSGVPENDREKGERICKVALWCIQYQPEARPSMTTVVRMLQGEEQIVPPVNPFLYMSTYDPSSSTSLTGTTRDTISEVVNSS